MGMPISLALRGRHADDARRPRRLGGGAWPSCAEVDRVFSTYRADSVVSRLDRGEIDARRLPARGRRGARPRRAGAQRVGRRLRRTPPGPRRPDATLDPSGVVKGWAVERASRAPRARCDDTDFCLSAGGDMVCRVADAATAAPGGSASRTRTTRAACVAVVPVRRGAVATSGTAHRGAPHRRRPHRRAARRRRLGHRRRAAPHLGRHRRHRGVRAWAPTRSPGCADARGRRGLVVWRDGRSDIFDATH